MIFVLLGMILGVYAGYQLVSDILDDDFLSWILLAAVTVMGWFAGAMVGFMVASAIGGMFGTNVPDTSRSYLGNLNDGTRMEGRISGNIFMTTGRIDEHLVYTYYKEVGEGEYQLSSLRADSAEYEVTIKQGDVERPYVETVGYRHEPQETWWYARSSDYSLESATFYVPEGSIVKDYILDAK